MPARWFPAGVWVYLWSDRVGTRLSVRCWLWGPSGCFSLCCAGPRRPTGMRRRRIHDLEAQSCNVSAALVQRLRGIRHVALDMDGTIYRGGTLFDFTNAFLDQLASLGIQ